MKHDPPLWHLRWEPFWEHSAGWMWFGSKHVAWMQFETLGLCFVLVLIARPKQRLPEPAVEPFGDAKRVKSRVTRAAFEFLYSV
jgi:hypothetical protein